MRLRETRSPEFSTPLPLAFGGPGSAAEGRVWITSHGTAAGVVATGTVTVRCTAGERAGSVPSRGADPLLRFLALLEASPVGQRSGHAARRLARAVPKPQSPVRPPAPRARPLESEPVPPSGAAGRRARA